jgi:hypothetical protein
MFSANWHWITLVVALLGSESKLKGKLEGTKWSSAAGVSNGNRIPAGTLKLEFRANGSFVYLIPDLTLTGKYVLGRGNNVVVTFDREVAGRKTHTLKVLLSDGKLTMRDSDRIEWAFDPVK